MLGFSLTDQLGQCSSRLHVVFTFFLVELAFFLGGCILILLVLRNEIVHVAFRFGELHFVHSSPVYQWRKAFRLNIAVKYSATRLNISWMAVELPAKETAIFKPLGGISQMLHLILFGIHSTKYEEFLFCTLSICSSTSFVDIRPRKSAAAVK